MQAHWLSMGDALAGGSPLAELVGGCSWLALLPSRLKLALRVLGMAGLVGLASILQLAQSGHTWFGWVGGLAIASWVPAIAWVRQAERDREWRVTSGMPELYFGSSTKRLSTNGVEAYVYRRRMTRDPDSWNRLRERSRLGRGLPGWASTKALPPRAPGLGHGNLALTEQIRDCFREHDYTGSVRLIHPDDSDGIVYLINSDAGAPERVLSLEHALRKMTGQAARVVNWTPEWQARGAVSEIITIDGAGDAPFNAAR